MLRNIHRDIFVNIYSSYVKYRFSCQILLKCEFSRPIFEKNIEISNLLGNPSRWEPSRFVRTDRRTDITDLMVSFRNFVNSSKHLLGDTGSSAQVHA